MLTFSVDKLDMTSQVLKQVFEAGSDVLFLFLLILFLLIIFIIPLLLIISIIITFITLMHKVRRKFKWGWKSGCSRLIVPKYCETFSCWSPSINYYWKFHKKSIVSKRLENCLYQLLG